MQSSPSSSCLRTGTTDSAEWGLGMDDYTCDGRTAYLTKEEADRLKLRVVPMHYTIAGNSYTEGFADENKIL